MMMSFPKNRKNCNLSERCHNRQQLENAITDKEYNSIILNDNSLDDYDIEFLCSLTYLRKLEIANTDITGSCLSHLFFITGIKEINLACNDSLNLALTKDTIIRDLPKSQLETLNLSGNQFDVDSLIQIIDAAFKSSRRCLNTLILGELRHLYDEELELLHAVIQMLPEVYRNCVVVESCALAEIDTTLNSSNNKLKYSGG